MRVLNLAYADGSYKSQFTSNVGILHKPKLNLEYAKKCLFWNDIFAAFVEKLFVKEASFPQ